MLHLAASSHHEEEMTHELLGAFDEDKHIEARAHSSRPNSLWLDHIVIAPTAGLIERLEWQRLQWRLSP